jgi:hypothetical protein
MKEFVMSIRRFLVPALTVIVLACGALAAHAQGTGPISGKKSGGSMPDPISAPGLVQGLSSDKVISLLKAKGAETTISNQELNGTKFTIVRAKLQADDFGYDLDVVFATYTNGVKTWYFSAPLNTNGMGLTLDKLQGLLKRNYTMGAFNTFMIDPQTGTVMIQSSRFGIGSTEQNFHSELDIYMKNIKEAYQLWSSGQ